MVILHIKTVMLFLSISLMGHVILPVEFNNKHKIVQNEELLKYF